MSERKEMLETTRDQVIMTMQENGLHPDEAIGLIVTILISMYHALAIEPTSEEFCGMLKNAYEMHTLITSKPEGSIQ